MLWKINEAQKRIRKCWQVGDEAVAILKSKDLEEGWNKP